MEIPQKQVNSVKSFVRGATKGSSVRNILVQNGLPRSIAKIFVDKIKKDLHGMKEKERKKTFSYRVSIALDTLSMLGSGDEETDEVTIVMMS